MDLSTHLNYRYPGTAVADRSYVSQQPQGSAYRVAQPTQDQIHPGYVYMCSDSGRITYARPPLGFTAGHQQNSIPIGPREAVHSGSVTSMRTHHMVESGDLSDQYIPSSSDKITCTDHRPLDEIFGDIRPLSGWVQATPASLHPSHNGASHRYPRHASVLTYPLPTKPQLDGVVQIPLLSVDNQMSGTGLVVDFQCSDWGIGVQVEGMAMSELLHGNVSDLQNPQQRVLDGQGLTHLRLNILWPHYPPFAKIMSAFGRDGKPITRTELGYEVSLAFAEFFYQITSQFIPPTRPGPYTISSSTESSCPGIRYDQLHLIRVRNTSPGEWMAEIRAVLVS